MAAQPIPLRRRWKRAQFAVQRRWRRARMRAFVDRMDLRPGFRVLDLGGTPEWWSWVDLPLEVTLFNTERALARQAEPGALRRVAGDACDLSRYEDGAFDVVFSNSVIEHVGGPERVAAFARELRRVGRGYWVQTPCYLFPVEAHTKAPFFWFYPRPLRVALTRWFDRPAARGRRPDPIGETTWFPLTELRKLFPDGDLFTERVAGLPKSWSLFRRPPATGARAVA